VFVDSSCGIVIDTGNQSEESVQQSIANAMINVAQQPLTRQALASGCAARARQFSWTGAAQQLYTAFTKTQRSR
jgi:glycosyltransferase involved in cell wall biosynthesis